MQKVFCVLFLMLSLRGLSQTKYQIFVDSLGAAMSDYINAHMNDFDSASFVHYFTQTTKQLEGPEYTISKEQLQTLPVLLLIRMIHHSSLIAQYLIKNVPKSKYWTYSTEMPPASISQEDCASFWTHNKFLYHDSDSTVVHLTLDKNNWLDSMSDNTYSRLSVERLNDQTFQSTFIESNNKAKSLLSMPGDIYCYQVLEKTDHSYKLSTHMKGVASYYTFELEY